MQIIELDLSHSNFFCPATGQRITGEVSHAPSPALAGMWHAEVPEEPELFHPELEALWNAYVARIAENGDEDDSPDIPESLSGVGIGSLVCFQITTTELTTTP